MVEGVPAGEVFLDEEPLVAVLAVLAIEGLQFILSPELFVNAGIQMVHIPA